MYHSHFLEEILSSNELNDLTEIMDFSLDKKIDLNKIQEKVAIGNFLQVKLNKIIYKLKMLYADLEVEYDIWYSTKYHIVIEEYDGFPELLKTPKDYEREIKKHPEFKEIKTLLKKFEYTITSLEMKEKEMNSFDWKVKGIIDLHKLINNIVY